MLHKNKSLKRFCFFSLDFVLRLYYINKAKKKSDSNLTNEMNFLTSLIRNSLSSLHKYSLYIYVIILVSHLTYRRVQSTSQVVNDQSEENTIDRFPVAKFNFEHVSSAYSITLWIILGILKEILNFFMRCSSQID